VVAIGESASQPTDIFIGSRLAAIISGILSEPQKIAANLEKMLISALD
jgi:hypothetical protein